jgi:type IV pilus assembly protein PilC
MLTYKYIARESAGGKKVKSIVQAESEQAAAKLLKEQGLSPIEIKLDNASTKGPGKFFNRIPTKERILFTRQLATLINAGLPLLQSMRSVMNQTSNKQLKVVAAQLISDVEGGSAFSAALARHPSVFNEIFISLVAAGEVSGTLDAALDRIANQQEKDAELLSKVRGAMVYPLIVILVMIAVSGFMIVKVLPQVEVLYDGLPGASLPLVTRILLGISHFLIKFWWLVIILLGIAGFFTSRWARTLGGKRVVDKAKMKAWPVGPLFMKMYMARFARTGNTLVASGVPLLQILEITARAINNVHIADSLKVAAEKVRGGKALSETLEGDENFLELVPNMIKIGEQSGAIEAMLGKVADYYEKEVDNQVKAITTIIEPILMIMLGIVAFTIVAAVLLPIYSLAGQNVIK